MERPKYRYHPAFQCTKNGHFRANMGSSTEADPQEVPHFPKYRTA